MSFEPGAKAEPAANSIPSISVEPTPLMLKSLAKAGDYFIPSIRYLHERIQGMQFNERTYRNGVQYEAKVVVRLGPEQVVAFNVPTGDFSTEPRADDLYGPGDSMIVLSEMPLFPQERTYSARAHE